MPLREDILAPIAGENPSGVDLRYDAKLLVYDKIKEARRQDDELAQGDWQMERKSANWPLVVKLAQDTLAVTSKDLQLAAYLTEALLHTERLSGLRQGLDLTLQLLTKFWDTVYPQIEDGDLEMRARLLAWIGSMLDLPLRSTPLVAAGYSFFQYRDSRIVGFEDQVKTDKDRKIRAAAIDSGKLAPELFEKAFNETPKSFYLASEKDLDECLLTLEKLNEFCEEKFAEDGPGFGKLKLALNDVRQLVHQLLDKKREKEPDPVEEVVVLDQSNQSSEESNNDLDAPIAGNLMAVALTHAEPSDRRQAMAAIFSAAAFLRKKEPCNPASYLLLRGLRWGELRTAEHLTDSALLEAPPTELRQQIKRLALAKRWPELLEAGEQAMSHPGSRAWLDLQRLTVTACTALGKPYALVARAVESELRALLNDLPELLDAILLDDTPAANPETREWLLALAIGPKPNSVDLNEAEAKAHRNGVPTWLAPAVDAYALAKDALAAGDEEQSFAIMRAEVNRQRSGRNRFRRNMQMVELAIAAGKEGIAQPLLEDIAATIENHKLDAWEDPEQLANDLSKLMRWSKKIQGNAGEKQKLFERICRLDPVQALKAG